MKRAVIGCLVAIAASPAAMAHVESGGPAHPNDIPTTIRAMTDADGWEWGIVRLSLRIEGGTFPVSRDGHLRVFKHRYVYTLTNADLPWNEGLVLTRFAPDACGSPFMALLPTLAGGPRGNPDGWAPPEYQPSWQRLTLWQAGDLYADGMLPGTVYRFTIYSDAEPQIATIEIQGFSFWEDEFYPAPVSARFLTVVPGCDRAPHAVTPEFDLDLAATAGPVSPGHEVRFTLRARNVGLGEATNVKLRQVLAKELRYLPGSLARDGAPVSDGGGDPFDAGLNIGTLAPGVAAEVTFEARVRPGVPAGTQLEHLFQLSSDQSSPFDSLAARTRTGEPDRTPPTLSIASPAAIVMKQSGMCPINTTVTDVDPGCDPEEILATLDGRPCATQGSFDMAKARAGVHTFTLAATDRAGNQAARAVSFTIAATIETTMQQVLRAYASGQIRMESTVSLLNSALKFAQTRLLAGDVPMALISIDAFRRAVNSPSRRTPLPDGRPVIDTETAELLTASADYLMKNPAP